MFDLKQPPPRQTITPLDREHRGLFEPNQRDDQTRRSTRVDFGDIGDLLKIRIEIDGSGEMPDYFLDKVELRDLDTEERMVSLIGKWLRWKGAEKHIQPYREFPVFRAAFEPLNSKQSELFIRPL
ncbi:unnamed protein product [Toxocara canis]|uniref:PLAT domain-containing protein n=1 Tax=Toxocara canis TaxID=6265 RepID=A0A183UT03_TOXCA|nr:unnamed protein product [Toxocara canis]